MLDQNTDRMWYVIGAVIVGAALIFLVNSSFPQLFASVGDTFKDKTEDVSKIVSTIGSNKQDATVDIRSSSLRTYRSEITSFDEATDEWSLKIDKRPLTHSTWSSGLGVKRGSVIVPFGESYVISYEIYVPLDVEDAYAHNDVNNSITTSGPVDSDTDNDFMGSRRFNGQVDPKAPLISGQWNKVWFSYSNTNVTKNPLKEAMYDYSQFGITNIRDNAINVKIRNVKGELGASPSM